MIDTDFILEKGDSRTTMVNNIVASSIHIYSHLMKFVGAKYKSKSWVKTVHEQNRQLLEVNNNSYWREAEGKIDTIKRKAIAEYVKEGNQNPEVALSIVLQSFPNLESLKSIGRLNAFMIEWCKKDKSDLAKDVLEYFERDK